MENHFTLLQDNPWKIFQNGKTKEYLTKWYLKNNLQLSEWAFDKPFKAHDAKNFVQSFVKLSKAHHPLPFPGEPEEIELVPCSITTTDFFDRILDAGNGVVWGLHGEIRGCFEEVIDDVTVADQLRQMLLNKENENYGLYSTAERKELIFRLFQHVAIGGAWCQYEDFVQPYIDTALLFYKDLLRIEKNKESSEVEIRSKCYKISSKNLQDFAYVLIDPKFREIILCTHKY